MTQPLRAGIIGAGFIGGVHARSVRNLGHVIAGATAAPGQAHRAAAELGAAEAYESAEALIASDRIDVVHICTPNRLHAPLTLRALAAGKHVICEKPVCVDESEEQELAAAVGESGRVTAVPFVYRFYPTVREARARLRAPDAAPVHLVHGSYLQDWMSRPEDTNWRTAPEDGGPSRTFADIGVHWCDLAEFTTGHRIRRLLATTSVVHPQRGGVTVETEDAAVLVFETDRGATGSVVASQVSPGRKNRLWLSVDSSDAAYVFDQELPDTLWVGGREENRVLHRGTATQSAGAAAYSTVPPGHPQGYLDSFAAFVKDAYTAFTGEAPDGLPTLKDGLRAAALTRAVLESSAKETWVEVTS